MTGAVHIPAKTLQGLQRTGPSSFNDTAGSGADFSASAWFAFIDELVRLGIPLDGVMYGVSWPADDHVPPQQVHYFCGLESDEEIPGLETLHVHEGSYFDFNCAVPASDLYCGFRQAYMTALPASGLTPRDGQHLEICGDDYDPSAEIGRFGILIPDL